MADLTLDKTMLQDLIQEMVNPSRRGPMVDRLMCNYGASERHARPILDPRSIEIAKPGM